MELVCNELGLSLKYGNHTILETTEQTPLIYVGYGRENIDMYRGNYKIEDYLIERYPLFITSVVQDGGDYVIDFQDQLQMRITQKDDLCCLSFQCLNENINRFWIRIQSDESEHCYGCGEQMSYFNLKGRHYPIWTSEPGVGRDKTTYVTWRSDVENKAGGDYYNTNYPQPTFVSSYHYYLHVDSTAYADFDFRNDNFHELQFWEVPKSIRIEGSDTFLHLLEKETEYFGRQPELPEWIYNGLIIGLQGGTERTEQLLEKTLEQDIKVAGVWCQDWSGQRVTSFGKRLQWDWHYHKTMYPDLPQFIDELHRRNIKFLGYINPYLVDDGELYQEGLDKGVFAKKSDGSEYLVDFGEFNCGVVDLTNPQAFEWFKNRVIKECSIDIGIDGWMADFGEYLPTDDIVLHNGVSPMIEHNHWPALWAKCNYDALRETDNIGKILYFMRAGGTGSQKYCTMLWAGDQSVDFSIHDGLGTVICAALSSGMSGCGLNNSDIGGYTSLFGNTRTKELFLRWAEMAVFTPMMRTHECNRPDENFQYYEDEDCMKQLARLVNIFTELSPYTKSLVKENADKGIPVQRPMFLHDEDDLVLYDLQYQYMFGKDMIVAPVYLADQDTWKVYLPAGEWIHLWSGQAYEQGTITVSASIGYPPVFFRADSSWRSLFENIRTKYSS